MLKNLKTSILMLLFLWSTFLCAYEPNQVIATIDVGQSPSGIAVTPDNLFAYVANNNNMFIGPYTVSVLNLTTNTVEATITDDNFNQPYTVTINEAGSKAYVTNSDSTTVSIIDIATNRVIGTIDGFDGPSGFVIAPNGVFAYVNNYGGPEGVGSGNGRTVNIVNLNTNAIVGSPITVGLAPAAMAITPDGAFLYVANYVTGEPGTGTISVIKTSNNSVVGTITGLFGPFAIAITPDGEYAYVTNFGSNNFTPVGTTVSVVSTRSNTIIATVPLGIQPAGIAINPSGSYVYVSNYYTLYEGLYENLTPGQGTVDIINVQTNTVVSPTINVGLSPGAIAISSDGQFAYVCNYSSNTVSVIPLLGLYDINRFKPIYNLQLDEAITILNQAGL